MDRAVSRETEEKLKLYKSLLVKWTRKINLVAPQTLQELERRHFQDSAQILSLASSTAESWVDLGSGGGFPGLVVAILAADSRPDLAVTLIESDHRKAAFLRTVSRETETPVSVLSERIEAVPPLNGDIVSARALAPLPKLLPLVRRHLAPGGVAFLPKGQSHQAEISAAQQEFQFDLEIHPSQTDPSAVILSVGAIIDV